MGHLCGNATLPAGCPDVRGAEKMGHLGIFQAMVEYLEIVNHALEVVFNVA
jgi:hypothetical protein